MTKHDHVAPWPVVPLKRFLHIQGSAGSNSGKQVGLENIESWTGRHVETGSSFDGAGTAFKPRDILFGKLRPYLAKAMIAQEIGSAVGDLWVLRPGEDCIPEFALYQLLDPNMIDEINSSTTGAKMPRADWRTVGALKRPFPPRSVQREIVDYLDCETRRIDDLIAEKSRFIALLRERRVAAISHAVTKGINDSAPMKPSGVEWIGDIPTTWKQTKLGYLGRSANGINIGAEAFGNGFPFVSYGDVYKNRQLPTTVKGLVMSTTQDQRTYSVQAGDVFFTRTSETIDEIAFPSVCMKTIPDAVFAGFLIRFRPYERVLVPGFSKYAFQNRAVRHFFAREMKLVTRASLSQGLLHSLPIPLPPLEEQEEIARYLEQKEHRFTSLVSDTERSIALLREKRAALITAAVTGKIDVRSAA